MILEERLRLGEISKDYYSCNLLKNNEGVFLDLGTVKIVFNSCLILKCGYPNDEIYYSFDYMSNIRMHCLYEVIKSPWIEELCQLNQVHNRHTDEIFEKDRHFIIYFKDEVFECISHSYELIHLPENLKLNT